MFAVFGKSYEKAREKALKKTSRFVGKGKNYRQLTDEEYQQALAENTEKLFQQMKPLVLSKEYSSPEICSQFIKLAEKQGYQGLAVKIKAPVQSTDKKGRQRVAAKWVNYVAGNDYTDASKNGGR